MRDILVVWRLKYELNLIPVVGVFVVVLRSWLNIAVSILASIFSLFIYLPIHF